MKKYILASLALVTVTLTSAQTVNTEIQSKGNDNKVVRKPITPTPDSRAERSAYRMKSDLTLDDATYNKVLTLKKEKYALIKDVVDKNPGSENRDARVKALKPLRDSYLEGLKEILTADQYTKFLDQRKANFEAWKKAAYAQPNAPKPDEEEEQIKIDLQ